MSTFQSVVRALAVVALVGVLPASVHAEPASSSASSSAIQAQEGASGTCTCIMGRGGSGGNATTHVLKQAGVTLTFALTGGRGGETPIEAGTVEGDTLKLKVTTIRKIEAKKKLYADGRSPGAPRKTLPRPYGSDRRRQLFKNHLATGLPAVRRVAPGSFSLDRQRSR
jgi:hypothetical protein